MCQSGKNNLNQQNRQYIYKTEEGRKNISHSFISGFTKWLQCKSKFVNIWKITRQFFCLFSFFLKLYTMITDIRLKKKIVRDLFYQYPSGQELVPITEKQALKVKAVKPPNAKP